jgi:hypothetical protein
LGGNYNVVAPPNARQDNPPTLAVRTHARRRYVDTWQLERRYRDKGLGVLHDLANRSAFGLIQPFNQLFDLIVVLRNSYAFGPYIGPRGLVVGWKDRVINGKASTDQNCGSLGIGCGTKSQVEA